MFGALNIKGCALAALAGIALGYWLADLILGAQIDRIRNQAAVDRQAAVQATIAMCEENNAVTDKTNRKLLADIEAVDARLRASLLRVRVASASASERMRVASEAHVAGTGSEFSVSDGVRVGNLLTLAARCDKVAIALNSCIAFVDGVWQKHQTVKNGG